MAMENWANWISLKQYNKKPISIEYAELDITQYGNDFRRRGLFFRYIVSNTT